MINNSYLLGLFGGSTVDTTSYSTTNALAAAKKQPTPPWSTSAVAPKADAMVRAALGGRAFINEDAARLDVKSASADYRKLFALYQGLDTLNALANRAAAKGVSALELSQLNKRFAAGVSEVGSWLSSADFDGVRMVQGTASAISKTSAGVARDSAVSVTAPIHEGSPDTVSPAFAGAVAFDISIRRTTGTTTVSIDLAEMGATPRTLTAVLGHINGKLEAAGVTTRLGREQVKAEPKTITSGGKTITLSPGADKWALVVRGDSTETVGFAATERADAVYVVQGAGTGGGHQLLKFQTDLGGAPPAAVARPGETQWVEGRAGQTALPPGVETVRASAAGPDGSLWLVADLDAGPANQPIKGQRDVALIKVDSAGRVVSTQALGAASTASGYAIAVDAQGRVAVAGSVTGALEPGKSGDVAAVADSFVTVFDAEGVEVWTQRRGARAADEATSVSFGPNGTVYVGGRSQGSIPGAAGQGGWDGYVQAFSESQAHIYAPVISVAAGAAQFGTAAEDGVGAIAVDGSNLYSAGVEDGRLVVRQFTLDVAGKPTLAATRDLGEASGEVAGLAVSGGRVILTGTTRNGSLDIGTVNTAHHGGTDAFVAVIEGDLATSANDRLTYVGAAGDDTAADVKVVAGKVWISGVADRALAADEDDPTQAFLARLDADTGAVEWRRDWQGDGQQAAPLTLAVASNGASVLDRLGLPQGEIDQSQSKLLTVATSARVGDRFYVSPADGGRAVAVTLDARDTLQTLARKIEQASNRKLKVTIASEGGVAGKHGETPVSRFGGFQRLSITARDGQTGAVLTAGEPGRDALAGLGLSQGYVGATSGDDTLRTFGLGLPRSLNLADPAAVKASGERLQAAMKAVRDAYRALAPQTTQAGASGPVPAYLTAQLANYQAALSRLGG
ncbi:transcriptional regulator [Brevundimonas sp.]|uniref:transcriptional regulator n=1 Tax=Brevundimonas sp. TaxID=1871086 RepID=UPI00273796F3|nr:transcriptional regulator [Brevundimonas sp.]MDP3802531.1 transcriptional regulator [Brevundimonas sp.]